MIKATTEARGQHAKIPNETDNRSAHAESVRDFKKNQNPARERSKRQTPSKKGYQSRAKTPKSTTTQKPPPKPQPKHARQQAISFADSIC